MVATTLYVEGGGDTKALHYECRKGFRMFLENAGAKGNLPRIVACGSREDAYYSFCDAIKNGEKAVLLVDSETPVNTQHQTGNPETWLPWEHLKQRDKWEKPKGAADTDCHLMVHCMESWFLADRDTLKVFFGQGFKPNVLPSESNPLENIAKATVYKTLKTATNKCKTKTPYDKGTHSFKLLERLDPDKVTRAAPWAKRFVSHLTNAKG